MEGGTRIVSCVSGFQGGEVSKLLEGWMWKHFQPQALFAPGGWDRAHSSLFTLLELSNPGGLLMCELKCREAVSSGSFSKLSLESWVEECGRLWPSWSISYSLSPTSLSPPLPPSPLLPSSLSGLSQAGFGKHFS